MILYFNLIKLNIKNNLNNRYQIMSKSTKSKNNRK